MAALAKGRGVMSNSGAVTLGDIAGKLQLLDVACSRCERRGRLSVAKLIERRGASAGLPDLRQTIAGDCPHVGSTSIHDRCGVHYPQLPSLFVPSRAIG
jgi:hypothetical protein